MPLDGLTLHAVRDELTKKIIDAKPEKIYQPEKDEIVLTFRSQGEHLRLVLSASANNPRVCLTQSQKENPAAPPLFCMLLRKHLLPCRLIGIEQPDFERMLIFVFEGYNELGDTCQKKLAVEIMGKHSNIILIGEENKIIDSVKRIDFTVSQKRQVLPGLFYEMPPGQDKQNPLATTGEQISEIVHAAEGEQLADKLILSHFTGLSPLICREIVYRALGGTQVRVSELGFSEREKLVRELERFFSEIGHGQFQPCIIIEENKYLDFAAVKITQYENKARLEQFSSMCEVIDTFYRTRDLSERMKQKSASLLKLVSNQIERCSKKIDIHNDTIAKSLKRDDKKNKADLIMANIYCIKQGMKEVTVQDFYHNNEEVTLTLDENLHPQKYAQKLYQQYNKLKTAESYAREQLKLVTEELLYLENVYEFLQEAKTSADLAEIREELAEQGYLQKQPDKKNRTKEKKIMPMKFESSDGYTIYVGKNNTQNDYITHKLARSEDIWLHTKDFHGSHAVIKKEHGKEIPDNTILEGAELAAYYSKARNSTKIPVDYTQIKYVKKPPKSRPGMVIYDNFATIYVDSDDKIFEKIRRI